MLGICEGFHVVLGWGLETGGCLEQGQQGLIVLEVR